KGYLRIVGGMISLGGALKLNTSGSEKVPFVKNFDDDDNEITPRNRRISVIERTQRHLIDRGIIRMVKGTAYLLTRMCGYSIPNRRDYQIDRIDSSFALQEETPRPASPSRSLAEPAATS
ncbi:MAG TPA: hypothetical protein VIJ14_06690, partial [Rhabdochlamydiaceae bacterium]